MATERAVLVKRNAQINEAFSLKISMSIIIIIIVKKKKAKAAVHKMAIKTG